MVDIKFHTHINTTSNTPVSVRILSFARRVFLLTDYTNTLTRKKTMCSPNKQRSAKKKHHKTKPMQQVLVLTNVSKTSKKTTTPRKAFAIKY